jgi:hypothetical protein
MLCKNCYSRNRKYGTDNISKVDKINVGRLKNIMKQGMFRANEKQENIYETKHGSGHG